MSHHPHRYPSYSVAIRTLGTAGEKYLRTLQSIQRQHLQPERILICLPDGIPPPLETIGKEEIICCKKGMVAQRCLDVSEIPSEFILFLDDDLEFGEDFVTGLFDNLLEADGDCIAPDIYGIICRSKKQMLIDYLTGGTRPHFFHSDWAFRIHGDSHFSYNNHPSKDVLRSQSAAGACALCRKSAYAAIHFEDEQWIDGFRYALGDDQLFFYKLHLYGYRVLISYEAKMTHLDGRAGHTTNDFWEKEYSYAVLRYLLWYRTIYETQSWGKRMGCWLSFHVLDFCRSLPLKLWFAVRHGTLRKFTEENRAYTNARQYAASIHYRNIPQFTAWRK